MPQYRHPDFLEDLVFWWFFSDCYQFLEDLDYQDLYIRDLAHAWVTCNHCSRHSKIPDFSTKFFSVFFLLEPWHKIPMRVYLGHAAFYEDETRYVVYPYADQRSFIVCVKVKWVLCYFVIASRPVAYVESLAGCRTWCPTDLQQLCCKALINK